MLFKKSPKKIGLEIGKSIFSEPIIESLWNKAKLNDCRIELHSVIAFGRLVAIKNFFPLSRSGQPPWSVVSETIDDCFFETVNHTRSKKSFAVINLGTEEEVFAVCSLLEIDEHVCTDICTFYGAVVNLRYHRYIDLLDIGFKKYNKGLCIEGLNIDCFRDLSVGIARDLTPFLAVDGIDEVNLSIAYVAMKGLSLLMNNGLYD